MVNQFRRAKTHRLIPDNQHAPAVFLGSACVDGPDVSRAILTIASEASVAVMCPACLCCRVWRKTASHATGPDEFRVPDADQRDAIKVACTPKVSSGQRSHSVWIFVIISLALLPPGSRFLRYEPGETDISLCSDRLNRNRFMGSPVAVTLGENRPGDSSHFIGHGHRRYPSRLTLQ